MDPEARSSQRRRRAFAWRAGLVGSVGLHVALLLGAPVMAELRPGGPAPGLSSVPHALTVRQVPPSETSDAPMLTAAPDAIDRLPRAEPDLPSRTQPLLAALTPQALLDTDGDDSLYLPRRQLDQPPRPLTPVDLPWPADGPPAGHFTERVSLFIDEAGVVQRVRIDGPGLPDALQAVVQDVFLRARFSPGQLAGQDVRSWMRLEVVFDAPSAAGSRGARR